MKKCITIILSFILMFAIIGCGGNSEPADPKQAAKEFDSTVWSAVLAAESTMQDLSTTMNSATIGEVSLLELYDTADSAKQYLGELSISFSSKGKDAEKYVEAAQNYIINTQIIASGICDYINTQEMQYLSDANGRIDSVTTYLIEVVSARMEYLTNAGLSDEEITALMDAE